MAVLLIPVDIMDTSMATDIATVMVIVIAANTTIIEAKAAAARAAKAVGMGLVLTADEQIARTSQILPLVQKVPAAQMKGTALKTQQNLKRINKFYLFLKLDRHSHDSIS